MRDREGAGEVRHKESTRDRDRHGFWRVTTRDQLWSDVFGARSSILLAAAAGWDTLAAELTDAASSYQAVIASLTDEFWSGPASMSMTAAVMPYIAWMTATAEQCQQAAAQATAAAAAFETAYAMTVPLRWSRPTAFGCWP